eukprot:scaffold242695_cov9-Tisochrysis_lutea.AAC.1
MCAHSSTCASVQLRLPYGCPEGPRGSEGVAVLAHQRHSRRQYHDLGFWVVQQEVPAVRGMQAASEQAMQQLEHLLH